MAARSAPTRTEQWGQASLLQLQPAAIPLREQDCGANTIAPARECAHGSPFWPTSFARVRSSGAKPMPRLTRCVSMRLCTLISLTSCDSDVGEGHGSAASENSTCFVVGGAHLGISGSVLCCGFMGVCTPRLARSGVCLARRRCKSQHRAPASWPAPWRALLVHKAKQ